MILFALTFASAAMALPAVVEPPVERPTREVVRDAAVRVSPERLIADINRLVSFGTRHTLSNAADANRGIGAARNWLKSEFEATATRCGKDRLEVSFDAFIQKPTARVPSEVEIVNVVATVRSPFHRTMETKEANDGFPVIYVLAHYDSRNSDPLDASADAPGANDDGSGTVALLELARVLADPAVVGGGGLHADIVLIATAGEEQSLLGATHAAHAAADRKANVRAVLNLDMIGDPTGTPLSDGEVPRDLTHVRVFSEGLPRNATATGLAALRANSMESDSPSREIARYIAETGEADALKVRAMLVFRPDRFLRGGDHMPFLETDFPAVRFTHVNENYDHQHQNVLDPDPKTGRVMGDLPRFVDKDYLAGVTRLVAAGAIRLANAPNAPKKARIVTKDLSTTTLVRWDKSDSPGVDDIAAYEVVWRETTSPVWTGMQRVEDSEAREMLLEVNKDNYFVGVRSVGSNGCRSPVVFAVAAQE